MPSQHSAVSGLLETEGAGRALSGLPIIPASGCAELPAAVAMDFFLRLAKPYTQHDLSKAVDQQLANKAKARAKFEAKARP